MSYILNIKSHFNKIKIGERMVLFLFISYNIIIKKKSVMQMIWNGQIWNIMHEECP